MTALDWIIVAFIVLMARLGLFPGTHRERAVARRVRARRLRRQPARAAAARRRGRARRTRRSSAWSRALMVGGLAAVMFEAMGEGIRRRLVFPLAGTIDGIGGAVLVAALGLALVWIAGAVALQTPGARKFRKDIQRSVILSRLNEALPPSGPILNALSRADPFPTIRGPEADVPAPTRRIAARSRRARRAAAASCASSARPAGSRFRARLGRRAGRGRDERARGRRRGRHDRQDRRGRRARREGGRSSTPTTTSRCCGSTGLGAPAAAAADRRRCRRAGRDPRLSRRTVRSGRSPGGSARRAP